MAELSLQLNYDYAGCIARSERVCWRLEDVFPPNRCLNFTQRFLPESLAEVDHLAFLNSEDKRKLNQVTSNAYLNIFSFVEEYIIGAMSHQMERELAEKRNRDTMRALSRFMDEEIKHQMLFKRFREAFDEGCGHLCSVLETGKEVAEAILRRHPIAVMLLTLHFELMTQVHFTESVKDKSDVEPFFASLLKHHWMEEAQHAKIDSLELEKMVQEASDADIEQAFKDYFDIIDDFDGMLKHQAQMDRESLTKLTGRQFSEKEGHEILASRIQTYRKIFLAKGMGHEEFLRITGLISTKAKSQIVQKAHSLLDTVSLAA